MNSLTKSDKAWIKGYFIGFDSAQEQTLVEIIRCLKKKLRHVKKVDK